jgi:hypothetical protein
MRDEELRERLAAWIRPVESLPAPDITILRRRTRRRRRRNAAMGVAALAAVAVTAGAILTTLPGGGSPARAPTSSAHPSYRPAAPTPSPHATWYQAGPLPAADAGPEAAPYFVTLAFQRSPVPALVTDAFTGQVIATVPPVPGTSFAGLAAAGDDHTFVLAAQTANGPGTRYYELRLGPTGRPRPLALLPVPATVHGGSLVFAVSADASRLAIAAGTADTARIEVVSLATGAVRSWRAAGGHATDLSWAGERTLAFEWWDSSRPSSVAEARSGVRLLDIAAPGHDLLASRFIIPQSASTSFGNFSGLDYPLISPDGSKVFATMVSGQPSNPMSEVVEFSALTGQALRVVTPPSGESGTGRWCGVLWVGPSGAHVTAVCGIEGRADNGHFTQMNLHVPIYNSSIPRDSFIAW